MTDKDCCKDRPHETKLSRRQVLKTAAAAGAALMAPSIVPVSALGRNGKVAPSERIILGAIGIGGRGGYDLRRMLLEKDVQFVAICDAKKEQREKIKQLADEHYDNKDCKMYDFIHDFLAERTDIDAILTATGDRWHAMSSVLSMRAGKDVYTEKPSCMTFAEGRFVVETAKRYGRVYQTGTQRLSQAEFVVANELLRLGKLGEVKTVRAHIAPWDAAELKHEWLPEEPLPPKKKWTGMPGSARAPGDPSTPPTSRADGAVITISTPAVSVSGARIPSRNAKSLWVAARRLPLSMVMCPMNPAMAWLPSLPTAWK